MKSDDIYLSRIRDSIAKIIRTTADMTEASFVQNETVTASTILWLAQRGELAKKLSPETRERCDAPWKQITGFRDMAVHQYFDLSLPDVWETIRTDIPALERALAVVAKPKPLPDTRDTPAPSSKADII